MKIILSENTFKLLMKRFFMDEVENKDCNLVNEMVAKRLTDYHDKNGYVIVSACREVNTPEENNKATQRLKELIKQNGYSFKRVYGGYKMKDTQNNVYEDSFAIFPYQKGENGYKKVNFEKLKKFAIDCCGLFKQESVLIDSPDKLPAYYDANGELEMEFTDGVSLDDYSSDYFTDLRKNSDKKRTEKSGISRFNFK